MEMTVELFDNIINTSQDCVFWKDKERRFLGVNQAFHNTSQADKRSFFERLYSDSDVLRVNIDFDNGSSYITATSGAASTVLNRCW